MGFGHFATCLATFEWMEACMDMMLTGRDGIAVTIPAGALGLQGKDGHMVAIRRAPRLGRRDGRMVAIPQGYLGCKVEMAGWCDTPGKVAA